MLKKKNQGDVLYRCSSCGYTQGRWLGHCPSCGQWNSFEEIPLSDSYASSSSVAKSHVEVLLLEAVKSQDSSRLSTGLKEFDRVLGGGAVKRSSIIIAGEPGIGKSTLLLQTAAMAGKKVLYVSGEESAGQIKSRADRLNLPVSNVELLCTSRLEDIDFVLNKVCPIFVIIDSIQTVFSSEAGIIPGTINQLKYCAHELVSWVKERDAVLFLTAHVTKEGSIAGPKALEHLVDTVIYFERNEDDLRFLRALKNRFGSIDELGIFSMDERGLNTIEEISTLFITNRKNTLPSGSATVPIIEGSRVFMVEVQALTVPAKGAMTRVFSDKIDSARVNRIAAVLEKRVGIRFSDQDIYINVAGGIKIKDPAADLALAIALYSSRTDIPARTNTTYIGELSLAGEVRSVKKIIPRIKAAQSLGFNSYYTPQITERDDIEVFKKDIVTVNDIQEAIKKSFSS